MSLIWSETRTMYEYYKDLKFKQRRAKQWHEIVELREDNRENPVSRMSEVKKWPMERYGFNKRHIFACSCRQCRSYKEKYNRSKEKNVDLSTD